MLAVNLDLEHCLLLDFSMCERNCLPRS